MDEACNSSSCIVTQLIVTWETISWSSYHLDLCVPRVCTMINDALVMSNWNLGHFTIKFTNSHQIHLVSDIISSTSIQITQATCTVNLPKKTCQTLVRPPFLWLYECDVFRLLDCYHWYWTLKLRSFPRN